MEKIIHWYFVISVGFFSEFLTKPNLSGMVQIDLIAIRIENIRNRNE